MSAPVDEYALEAALDAVIALRWRFWLARDAYQRHFVGDPEQTAAWRARAKELVDGMETAHRESVSARERLNQAIDAYVTRYPFEPPPAHRRWSAWRRAGPQEVP